MNDAESWPIEATDVLIQFCLKKISTNEDVRLAEEAMDGVRRELGKDDPCAQNVQLLRQCAQQHVMKALDSLVEATNNAINESPSDAGMDNGGFRGQLRPDNAADQQRIDTSAEAYRSIAPEGLTNLRQRIWMEIAKSANGMTCEEVEAALDLRHTTASARITELKDEGAIRESGRYRRTISGRRANVYVSAAGEEVPM